VRSGEAALTAHVVGGTIPLVLLIRALLAWIVVFAVVLMLTSLLGGISSYELVILLVVSVVLTALLLHFWDRRHPTDTGRTSSS
jgi:membrane protein implicated in regulation of membrane protease activity